MTDKELLEFAAKAAGIKYIRYQELNPCGLIIKEDNEFGFHQQWNPLTDDGDALRLAVKLRINIEWTASLGNHREEWINTYPRHFGHLSDLARIGDDQYSSTRRAIVRAAAEICKNA